LKPAFVSASRSRKGRNQGGAKWIGAGRTSPFGGYGYKPEGMAWAGQIEQPIRCEALGTA
jgi:uncharacterized protein with von Willebrand factor type A (vWA) domain